MSFAPTDALAIQVTVGEGSKSVGFDALSVAYTGRIHGSYGFKALVVSDTYLFPFERQTSALQLGLWTKISIESERFEPLVFQGKIQALEGASKFANGKELVWIECVPECHELFINRRAGIYYGGSVTDIIERGLDGRFKQLGYHHTDVRAQLSQKEYPSQLSMTQYAESDMAFILRQLAEYGIAACFRQDFSGKSGVSLLVSDHNSAFNNQGEVALLQDVAHEGAGLYQASISTHYPISTVRAIYFDEANNQYIIEKQDVAGSNQGGMIDHHCLGNCLDQKQVAEIAKSVKEGFEVHQQVLEAKFQGLAIQPGDIIEVNLNGQNTPCLIQTIHYEFSRGNQEEHQAEFKQNHHLTALPLIDAEGKARPYRPAIWIENPKSDTLFQREYPNCNYKGVLSGCYGLATGEIVVPDQLGNMPVQFPYNYTEVCGNIPARYTRVISLSNEGGTTGRSFPIYQDTELQVMFANGNMDYPLIKGAAANRDTGHVHNSTVQQRTHYALPQGQSMTYSNVPGDNNFITHRATHSEGTHQSFTMLSNYQDPDNPGMKKMDSIEGTTGSKECSVKGDCHIVAAKGVPVMAKPWPVIPSADDDYYLFLSTVYGESASVPNAWEAVADSIVLRARNNNDTPGNMVSARWQYDAYINPSVLSGEVKKNTIDGGQWQFLKAYAYAAQQKLNGKPPMTFDEAQTLQALDSRIRPVYAQYKDKTPLKYMITNYYSPGGQGDRPVGFLKNISDPDKYLVDVPDVTDNQFKFYNIP